MLCNASSRPIGSIGTAWSTASDMVTFGCLYGRCRQRQQFPVAEDRGKGPTDRIASLSHQSAAPAAVIWRAEYSLAVALSGSHVGFRLHYQLQRLCLD